MDRGPLPARPRRRRRMAAVRGGRHAPAVDASFVRDALMPARGDLMFDAPTVVAAVAARRRAARSTRRSSTSRPCPPPCVCTTQRRSPDTLSMRAPCCPRCDDNVLSTCLFAAPPPLHGAAIPVGVANHSRWRRRRVPRAAAHRRGARRLGLAIELATPHHGARCRRHQVCGRAAARCATTRSHRTRSALPAGSWCTAMMPTRALYFCVCFGASHKAVRTGT